MSHTKLTGCIIDIEGLPTECLHNIWWETLQYIYDHYAHASNPKIPSSSFTPKPIHGRIFSLLKNTLSYHHTWGVFIHYLCYHGPQNIHTGHSFYDHLFGYDMEGFLNTRHYIKDSTHTYLDSYILNALVTHSANNTQPCVEIKGYEEYDNGKVTILCKAPELTDSFTESDVSQHIIDVFKTLDMPTQKITHMKCTLVPEKIVDFGAPFLAYDIKQDIVLGFLKKSGIYRYIDNPGEWMPHYTVRHRDKHYVINALHQAIMDLIFEKYGEVGCRLRTTEMPENI